MECYCWSCFLASLGEEEKEVWLKLKILFGHEDFEDSEDCYDDDCDIELK